MKKLHLENPVLYPIPYLWFILLASLDIILTWVALTSGAMELNPVADYFVYRWGISGLIWLKFGVLVVVVVICEWVGRHREKTGRRLAHWAVALNSIPVVVTLVQMIIVQYGHTGGGG